MNGQLRTAVLLFASSLAAIAFVVVYIVSANTQLLGITMGLALALIAAALVVASRDVVPQEQAEEERAEFAVPEEQPEREEPVEHTIEVIQVAGSAITRRRLLGAAGGAAGLALGAAALAPLASLGPAVGDSLRKTAWKDGVPLVDEDDAPVAVDELERRSYITAFPKGADKEEVGSPVLVLKLDQSQIEEPIERPEWAPQGVMAFSKICTHAGCAVGLYRSPLFPDQAPGPALVCPCHYSTFDVLKGGQVIFGPAGRPLPQLPLRIERSGLLVAAGPLSGNPGPAWAGVRRS
jgi:ubiquinol-cytochrome c reductase iron-sulfur subunit